MQYDGKVYEIVSGHNLSEDAWHYELSGLSGAPGTGPFMAVAVPDATPDGLFAPRSAQHVMVHAGGGVVPWPILEELLDQLDSCGDLIDDVRDLSAEATALNTWSHGSQQFEVNRFRCNRAWCYELYAIDAAANRYIRVRITDAPQDSGPFVPMPADRGTLTMHGRWSIPWPVFRRFLDASSSGTGPDDR
ncbi:hypothetical protein AB0M02_10530 [Actinoplanes sp. NPDC051861]|uniref:hypothetical protein n=1 Tax=Actinoplanes sp. NPDC051861 TaxID=3155170 RepID=UPI0034403306